MAKSINDQNKQLSYINIYWKYYPIGIFDSMQINEKCPTRRVTSAIQNWQNDSSRQCFDIMKVTLKRKLQHTTLAQLICAKVIARESYHLVVNIDRNRKCKTTTNMEKRSSRSRGSRRWVANILKRLLSLHSVRSVGIRIRFEFGFQLEFSLPNTFRNGHFHSVILGVSAQIRSKMVVFTSNFDVNYLFPVKSRLCRHCSLTLRR